KPPEAGSKEESTGPDQPAPSPGQDVPVAAAGSTNPSLTSDQEKTARIEEAKARAAAAKDALAAPGATTPAAGAPKAPVKKKEEGPKPMDAASHPLVQRLKKVCDGAVLEASEFLAQLSIRIAPGRITEVCLALKGDDQTPFDYLSD